MLIPQITGGTRLISIKSSLQNKNSTGSFIIVIPNLFVTESSAGGRISVNRAVLDQHLVLPRQMVFACGKILGVGKNRVTFTARLSDISAVTEIVNVVLKSCRRCLPVADKSRRLRLHTGCGHPVQAWYRQSCRSAPRRNNRTHRHIRQG